MSVERINTYSLNKLLNELEDYGELEGVSLHISELVDQIRPCLSYINFLEDTLMNNGLDPDLLIEKHNENWRFQTEDERRELAKYRARQKRPFSFP